MKKVDFYNNIAFRIGSPIVLGTLMYLLILMAFDSLRELYDNFFSNEFFFILVMTFLFLELNRAMILLFSRRLKLKSGFLKYALVQVTLSIALSIVLVSFFLYSYFILFVGFTTIETELGVFNSLFGIAALAYQSYTISLKGFEIRNDDLINYEESRRKRNKLIYTTYKNALKPEFLLESLETVLLLINRNKKEADEVINNLSGLYRYTLSESQSELKLFKDELNALTNRIAIVQKRMSIDYHFDAHPSNEALIVPGVLFLLFEEALNRNLIDDQKPLKLHISMQEDQIVFRYSLNERLMIPGRNNTSVEQLKNIYDYYKPGVWRVTNTESGITCKFPVLQIDEEE